MDDGVCDCCGGAELVAGRQCADPLLRLITAYRAALADFDDNAPDDDEGRKAYAAASYVEPRQVLVGWRGPALSRAGAMAALQLAADAEREGDYPVVGPMIEVALTFLGGRYA